MTAGPADSLLDVLVIGGGQAGLAMGYHLAQSGRSFQIVDAGAEIGGMWQGPHPAPAGRDALPRPVHAWPHLAAHPRLRAARLGVE